MGGAQLRPGLSAILDHRRKAMCSCNFRKLCKAIVAAGATVLVSSGVHAAPLTVVSWGGSYGDAQDAALFDDASKNTGIEILRESGASMSKTCLQVQSGSVTWDLVVTGSGGGASAAADGCLEKIDFDVVDVSDFYPDTYTDYCVGSDIFATVMAWNTITVAKISDPTQ